MYSPNETNANEPTTNEDIWRILTLLKEGEEKITFPGHQNATIILGNTGSGKTTFTELIASNNENLYSEEVNEGSGEFIILDKDDKIGANSTVVSKTTFPELMIDDVKTAYIDCPGFNDSRNEAYDIAVSYFITKVLKSVKNIKFVLVVSYPSLRKGVSRNDFTQLLKHFTKILKNLDKYADSIALIATKVDNAYVVEGDKVNLVQDKKVLENIAIFLKEVRNNFKQILENGSSILKTAREQDQEDLKNSLKLIDILLTQNNGQYERIGIIRRPDRKGALNNIPALQKNKEYIKNLLQSNIKYVNVDNADIGYTVSDKAKNIIRDLAEELNKEIRVEISMTGANLIEYYSSEERRRLLTIDIYSLIGKLQTGYQLLSTLKKIDYSAGAEQLAKEMLTQFEIAKVQIPSSTLKRIFKLSSFLNFLEDVSSKKFDSQTYKWSDGLIDVDFYLENSKLWYELLERLYERLSEYEIQIKFDNHSVSKFENEIPNENDTVLVENIPALISFIDQLKGDDDWLISIVYRQLKKIRLNKVKMQYLDAIVNSTLKEIITKDYIATSPSRFTVIGEFVRFSQLTKMGWNPTETALQIYAKNTVFIDANLKDVQDIFIMARRWHIVGDRKIDLNGDSRYNKGFGYFFGIGQVFKGIENLTITGSNDEINLESNYSTVKLINLSKNEEIPKVIIQQQSNDYRSLYFYRKIYDPYPRSQLISEYFQHITDNLKNFIKKRDTLQFYTNLWQNANLTAMDNKDSLTNELKHAENNYNDFNSDVNKILYNSFLSRFQALSSLKQNSIINAAIRCKLIRLNNTSENRLITSRMLFNDLFDLFDQFDENKIDLYHDKILNKYFDEVENFLYSNLLIPIADLISSNNDQITQMALSTEINGNKMTDIFLRRQALRVFKTTSELLRITWYWMKLESEVIRTELKPKLYGNSTVIFEFPTNSISESKTSLKLLELQQKHTVLVNTQIVADTLLEGRKLIESEGFCNNQCRDLKQIEIQLEMAIYKETNTTILIERAMQIRDNMKNKKSPSEKERKIFHALDRVKLYLILNNVDKQIFTSVKNMTEQSISTLVSDLESKNEMFENFNNNILSIITNLESKTKYSMNPIFETASMLNVIERMKSTAHTFINKLKITDDLSSFLEGIDYVANILTSLLETLRSQKDRKLINAYIHYVNEIQPLKGTESLKSSIKKDIALYEYDKLLHAYKRYVFPLETISLKFQDLPQTPTYNNTFPNLLQSLSNNIRYMKNKILPSDSNTTNELISEDDFSSNTKKGPFFKWKNSFHAETISRLLKGENVFLVASMSKNPINEMIKFGNLRLRFKLPNNQADEESNFQQIIKNNFLINLTHSGTSQFSFCRRRYFKDDYPISFISNINQTEFANIDNKYELSPYTTWYFQLSPNNDDPETVNLLKPYHNYKFDLLLEGRAQYISTQNESVCDQFEKTVPFYHDFENNPISALKIDEKLELKPVQRKRRQIDDNVKASNSRYWNNSNQSSTQNGMKHLDFQSRPWLTPFSIPFNLNASLTLADFFVRCVFKTKPVPTEEIILDLKDIRQSVLCILDEFESILNDLSDRYYIPWDDFEYDPVEVMSRLEKELLSGNGRTSELIDILSQSVSWPLRWSSAEVSSFLEDLQQRVRQMLLSVPMMSLPPSSYVDGVQFGSENTTHYGYGYSSSVISNQNISTVDSSGMRLIGL